MILPIRTSIRPWRTPYANYVLIAVNILIFFITYAPVKSPFTGQVVQVLRPWANRFMLDPSAPAFWQFVSYAFLHGGFLHILGNMYFLYLFGNNVNDRLGHFNYILLFLSGSILSAAGHMGIGALYKSGAASVPLIGASGAVAAITGAYLVLFPQTVITIIYFFFFIGTMDVPALYFIIFKLILLDNVIARYTPMVAYDAHLAGYAFGASVMLFMLATGLLSGSGYDLWAMIRQWNRRRRYRDAVSSGFDPFRGTSGKKKVKVKNVKTTTKEKEFSEKVKQLRSVIAERMEQRNLSAAADSYLELMETDNSQIIPRQYLLDIANQLASENKYEDSAEAYEQFLHRYSNYEYSEQVELMAGIIYSRYLHKQKLAIEHLHKALDKLSDPAQIDMCKEELSKLEG